VVRRHELTDLGRELLAPLIPRAATGRPPGFDRESYRRRNVIERCFNRLKGFRGIATRYE
jgi:transposase